MDAILEWMLVPHQILGYLTAFIIGPGALVTWRKRSSHRRWGKAFFISMLVLYISGTPRSFYLQPFLSWGMFRNVTFNFFGVLLLLLGYRAIRLWSDPHRELTRLDRALSVTLWVTSIAMMVVGLRDLPMFVFGGVAMGLAILDRVDLRSGKADSATHLRRHLRYIFGSYYYLITVISILHFPAGHDFKWLWPTVLGLTVWIAAHLRSRLQNRAGSRQVFPLTIRAAIYVNACLCGLILYHGSRHVYDRVVATPAPFHEKLDAHFRTYDRAREELARRVADGRAMFRSEWESLLRPAYRFRFDDEDLNELRQRQLSRIQQAAETARLESKIDLVNVRESGRVREFCEKLPKGGMLHVHPNGTLRRDTVEKLLAINDPEIDIGQLKSSRQFSVDELSFLDKYKEPVRFSEMKASDRDKFCGLYFLRSGQFSFARFDAVFGLVGLLRSNDPEQVTDVICDDFFRHCSEQRIRYVEFTCGFPPTVEQLHAWERRAQSAEQQHGVLVRINFAFNRAVNSAENLKTLEQLIATLRTHPSEVVVGIDLLGSESRYPALESGHLLYGTLLARRSPLRRTIHAAGLGDTRNCRDAILMGAERLGHGTHLHESPMALEYASQRKLPIEVNLVSNVRLGYADDFTSHSFLDQLRLGCRVSLSTDDEGILCTDLNQEFVMAIQHSDIQYAEVKQLVYNSIETAFCRDDDRSRLMSELDEAFARFESEWNSSRVTVAERIDSVK